MVLVVVWSIKPLINHVIQSKKLYLELQLFAWKFQLLAQQPEQVAKTASITSVSDSSNISATYYMAVQVFECSATSFGTSCHRNLSNSPVSITCTFSSPFSNTRTLLDYKASTQQQGPASCLELLPQDLDRFRTLQRLTGSCKLH